MKNVMIYRNFSMLSGLAAIAMLVGCHTAPKMHGEEFTSETACTSTGRIAQAQCANGAKEDGMLFDHSFAGSKLNSLGQGKLDLIVKATHVGQPVYVYLDMPHDLVVDRQGAVTEYLKTAGVDENKIIVAEGPNPNLTTPSAYNLSGLYKEDGTSYSGKAAVDTTTIGGAGSSGGLGH